MLLPPKVSSTVGVARERQPGVTPPAPVIQGMIAIYQLTNTVYCQKNSFFKCAHMHNS